MPSIVHKRTRGVGLVEIIIAAAIVGVAFVGIIGALNLFLSSGFKNTENIQAAYYSEEALEAVRFLRDSSWTTNIVSKTIGTNYYLSWNGGAWTISTTPTLVNGFVRTIVFGNLYRDNSTKDLSEVSGGSVTLDASARKVTVSVRGSTMVATTTTVTYLTDLFAN